MELYPLLPGESIELRAKIPGKEEIRHRGFFSSWEDADEQAQKWDCDFDVYFGVAPRVPDESGVLKGAAANVRRIPVVWMDADVGDKHVFTKEERLAQVMEWKPTHVIDSGGGYHVYWVLAEDVSPERGRHFMDLLRQELKSDNVSDAPRVLRWPNTKNYKYDPPRFVDVIVATDAKCYLGDLESRITVTPASSNGHVDHAKRIALIEKYGLPAHGGTLEDEVFDGRDRALYDAASFWKNEYQPEVEVYSRCLRLNKCFDEPLTTADVAKKVKSAFTYEPPPNIVEVIEVSPIEAGTKIGKLAAFTVQSLADILDYNEPATEWIADGVLARGHIVYTMNPPKSGKSSIALNFGLRMAAGLSGGGLFIDQRYRTLFLQPMGDMHPSLTREWARKISTGLDLPKDIPFDIAVLGERADHFKYLHDHAEKYDLVIVDTISRLFPAVDDKDTRTVSEELDKIRRLRMLYPQTCWLYLVQVGKNSLTHMRGATPGFAARGNSAIAEVFDDAIQLIVPTEDFERDEELGLNLTRHIVMMGRGAAQYRKPWRTRFNPETHVIDWVQDLTYDEAIEASGSGNHSKPTQTTQAADLLGRLFLDAEEATGERKVLAAEAYRMGEANGFSKRVMKLALESRAGTINPPRGPNSAWWDFQVEVVEE